MREGLCLLLGPLGREGAACLRRPLPQDSAPVVDQQLLYTCCPYIGECPTP